ncbi:MAG TPA: hypothetical protein VGC97_15190 [Pyrinomonadaceae bacterium]|jgi:hypothetical protein
MEQFKIQNLNVRVSTDFNYVWVLLEEQVRSEQFAASLGDAEFHSLLQRYHVRNILLDCSKMWVFSIPEMSAYLDTQFTNLMVGIGVEKISVIVNEEVFRMLSGIFQGIEFNHLQNLPQIRFFGTASFYESFESVAWF